MQSVLENKIPSLGPLRTLGAIVEMDPGYLSARYSDIVI